MCPRLPPSCLAGNYVPCRGRHVLVPGTRLPFPCVAHGCLPRGTGGRLGRQSSSRAPVAVRREQLPFLVPANDGGRDSPLGLLPGSACTCHERQLRRRFWGRGCGCLWGPSRRPPQAPALAPQGLEQRPEGDPRAGTRCLQRAREDEGGWAGAQAAGPRTSPVSTQLVSGARLCPHT